MGGWIGVDLDGTLAMYCGWADSKIGAPIPEMVARVKQWLKDGTEVKIFTARVGMENYVGPEVQAETIRQIKAWCKKHIGQELEVTASKDFGMIELWDDRAVRVIRNTGKRADKYDDDNKVDGLTRVIINKNELTVGQVLALTVALNSFCPDTGSDEHGKAMAVAYKERVAEILTYIAD